MKAALLLVACAVLGACGPASLEQTGPVVTGRPDGGADTGGQGLPDVSGPCLPPAADPALARFQAGVVGSWTGTAITPDGWTWSRATVEFTFFCDGHYHDRCLAAEGIDPEGCVALYYGSDDDDPHKTYEINDVRADGKAKGNVVVWFGAETGSTVDDQLDAIDLAADGSTLAFDFFHFGQYGPVHYDLARATF